MAADDYQPLPSGPSIATKATSATWQPGELFGPYRIREKIGEGGSSVVYAADQARPTQRMVALKIIKSELDSRKAMSRFELERQALERIDHPHVARLLDAGTEQERLYFAIELVPGVSITSYCDEHQLTIEQRLELFATVCDAIQHAHQNGIIHRDLKARNVLVASAGAHPVAKVIDFGHAKLIGHPVENHDFDSMRLVGTPAYMSPEQAGPSRHEVDIRSDIYSLGVVLFELLTGSTPLRKRALASNSFEEIRRRIQELDAPRASERIASLRDSEQAAIATQRQLDPQALQGRLRGNLDNVIAKSIDKDRNKRYSSAEELFDEIQQVLRGEPVNAKAPAPLSPQEQVAAEQLAEEQRRQQYNSDMKLCEQLFARSEPMYAEIRVILATWIPLDGKNELRGSTWQAHWERLRAIHDPSIDPFANPGVNPDVQEEKQEPLALHQIDSHLATSYMLLLLGMQRNRDQRFPEAEELLSRAHAIQQDAQTPNEFDLAEIAVELATAQLMQQKYESATQTLDTALARDPGNASLLEIRAAAHLECGRFRDAGLDYQQSNPLAAAVFFVLADDTESYRKLCGPAWHSSFESDEARLKTCLLIPDVADLAELPFDQVKKAKASHLPISRLNALALYCLRSGNLDESNTLLQQARELREPGGVAENAWATTLAIGSIIASKQNHCEFAESQLAEAQALIHELTQRSHDSPQHRLWFMTEVHMAELLVREAANSLSSV